MGFLRDRPERHGSGGKPLDDFRSGFHLCKGNRALCEPQFHQASQRGELLRLVIDQSRVFLERFELVLAYGHLQFADCLRIQQVVLATDAVMIVAAGVEFRFRGGNLAERKGVFHGGFTRQHVQADAFDARGRAGEVLVDQLLVQADGFEHLRAAIALQR